MDKAQNRLSEIMKKLGASNDPNDFAQDLYLEERMELQTIADSLPKDGVLDINDIQRLQRLCIRGMNICDDWIPRLHVLMTVFEVKRDVAKALAYTNAKPPENSKLIKLTIDAKKAIAERDEDFNKLKVTVEQIKGSKIFHEKKKDTLKSAYYMFRDQLVSYNLSDKGNSGEQLQYQDNNTEEQKTGRISW